MSEHGAHAEQTAVPMRERTNVGPFLEPGQRVRCIDPSSCHFGQLGRVGDVYHDRFHTGRSPDLVRFEIEGVATPGNVWNHQLELAPEAP